MVDHSDMRVIKWVWIIIKWVWIIIAAACAYQGSVTITGNFLLGYQENLNYLLFFWEWACLVGMGEFCIGCCFCREDQGKED